MGKPLGAGVGLDLGWAFTGFTRSTIIRLQSDIKRRIVQVFYEISVVFFSFA
jgi:hypothetical protein